MIENIFSLTNLKLLGRGAAMTLLLASVGVTAGAIFGTVLAVVRTYPARAFRLMTPLVWLYVEIFRRTPLLILILLTYFGLALAKVEVSNVVVAIVAISITSIAYMCENVRAGIESLPRAQWDAGFALGMHGWQTLFYIILPQALRLAIPPSIGFMQSLIKDTSMATIIGIVELTHAGVILRYRFPLGSFYIFGAVMIAYFLICYPLSWAGDFAERRLRRE